MNSPTLRGQRPRKRRFATRLVRRGVLTMREGLTIGARPLSSLRWTRDREYRRAFPGNFRRLRRGLGTAGAGIVVAGLLGVVIHPTFAVLGLAALLVTRFVQQLSSRPNRGRHRRWPPGSIGSGPEAMMQPDYFLAASRRHGPVFKASLFGSPMVCVVGVEAGTTLLRVHEADLALSPLPYNRFVPEGMLRWMEEPQHTEYRRMFARGLSARFISGADDGIRASVHRGLDSWYEQNRADPRRSGPLPFVRELVLSTWIETLLGISPGDPWHGEVCAIFEALDIYRPSSHTDGELRQALARLDHLVAATASPGVGTRESTSLAKEFLALRSTALADPTVTRNLIFTALTTHDDIAGLFLWILRFLSDHPEWVDRARADPDGSVADAIVSETLRLEQSEFLFRMTKRDIEFGGFVLPANWMVRICVHEGHRDPAKFDHPDDFDPARFLDGRCGRDTFAPFGMDHRSCVGEALTRSFAGMFVTELVRHYDWEVIADGPREFSAHRHWAPSGQLRLALRRRVAD